MAKSDLFDELRTFADEVHRKLSAKVPGEPEDQLRAPFEALLKAAGRCLGLGVVPKGETLLADRLGKPDYAVPVDGLLNGYAELKAPGTGANTSRFRGRNRDQWKRFSELPNVLYTDGDEWAIYRAGERAGGVVRVSGSIESEGMGAIAREDADRILSLLRIFLTWEPIVPKTIPQLVGVLAPLCRSLRKEVEDSLEGESSALSKLYDNWRDLLFPEASHSQFADAYAQTITYALLLARAEGARALDTSTAAAALRSDHSLLSKALEVLADPAVRKEVDTSVSMLERVLIRIDPAAIDADTPDPWLYFYEDFLAEYDPQLRKDSGVYYTPVEVVRAQVRMCQDLLEERFRKPLGFADPAVVTLDPGVGTGTYLLGIIDRALTRVADREGRGAVPGRATGLAQNLKGFEIMVGPYAVAELRLRAQLALYQADTTGTQQVFLTNTLASPFTAPKAYGLFYEPMSREQERALEIKDKVPVFVCIGNPPYDRHDAAEDRGGWIRHGGEGDPPPLEDFAAPVRVAGEGGHLKNLYNLYVYFWRWAIWKTFEHNEDHSAGIVSFISAASFLQGPGFAGMREWMRREADEIWVIDLGGEGRGTRKNPNVFAIQTPVAITTLVRYRDPNRERPALVRYARIHGSSRAEKLRKLDEITSLTEIRWEECRAGWGDRMHPPGSGTFFEWPDIRDLFPWQHSGCQMKRTWPIATHRSALEQRWKALTSLSKSACAELFRETRDRKVSGRYPHLAAGAEPDVPLNEEAASSAPTITRYGFRSFDEQVVIADTRVGDFMRPVLWRSSGPGQVYFVTLASNPVAKGPSVSASASVPDLHFFRGSFGGRDVMPLWRDAAASEPNLAPGWLDRISEALELRLTPDDLAAYVFGVTSSRHYTSRFFTELARVGPEGGIPGPRVPITLDAKLFQEIRDLGKDVLLYVTGTDVFGSGRTVLEGKARCVVAPSVPAGQYPESFEYDRESEELIVGGGVFAPVSPEVWEYEVSGLEVVSSWLGYRKQVPSGRRSSELDDLRGDGWTAETTSELLSLLWRLEAVLSKEEQQGRLLEEVLQGPLVKAAELPPVPEAARAAPTASQAEEQEELALPD